MRLIVDLELVVINTTAFPYTHALLLSKRADCVQARSARSIQLESGSCNFFLLVDCDGIPFFLTTSLSPLSIKWLSEPRPLKHFKSVKLYEAVQINVGQRILTVWLLRLVQQFVYMTTWAIEEQRKLRNRYKLFGHDSLEGSFNPFRLFIMDRPAIAQDLFKDFSSDLFDRFSGDLDFNTRHINLTPD